MGMRRMIPSDGQIRLGLYLDLQILDRAYHPVLVSKLDSEVVLPQAVTIPYWHFKYHAVTSVQFPLCGSGGILSGMLVTTCLRIAFRAVS